MVSCVVLHDSSRQMTLGSSCSVAGSSSGAPAARSTQCFIHLALHLWLSLSLNAYWPRTQMTFSRPRYGDHPFSTGPAQTNTISPGQKNGRRRSQWHSSSSQLTSEIGGANYLQEMGLSVSGLTGVSLEAEHNVCNKEAQLVHETIVSGAASAAGAMAVDTAILNAMQVLHGNSN